MGARSFSAIGPVVDSLASNGLPFCELHDSDHTFQQGDAFTIEPGIHLGTSMFESLPDTPKNRAFIAKVRPVVQRYENTGVRIEDDYVITDKELERISTAPREIAEIAAIMRTRPPRAVP